MNELMQGAIILAGTAIGLFFLRFWKSTGDRFFLFFFLSFWIDAASRLYFRVPASQMEAATPYFLLRVFSYSLILVAVLDKNWPKKKLSSRE